MNRIEKVLNHSLKLKVNKKDCKGYLDEIIGRLTDEQFDENCEILAKLYSFFWDKKTPTVKTEYDWVSLAVSKNVNEPTTKHVYVKDGKMVATDSYRLHVADTNLPDGFYIAGVKVEYEGRFPDYKRVIGYENHKSIGIKNLEDFTATITDSGIGAYRLDLQDGKSVVLNAKFLKDILTWYPYQEMFVHKTKPGLMPVFFKIKSMESAIMPLNMIGVE
jgi:hypothetical protein